MNGHASRLHSTKLLALLAVAAAAMGCKDAPSTAPANTAHSARPNALLITQAQFVARGDDLIPGPAKLVILTPSPGHWHQEVIEDAASNVFHKAVAWRKGILTIGGEGAVLRHFTHHENGWTPKTLWQRSWGGKFDRLRDLEIGNVDGDPAEELVLATHDMGVVAIGNENPAGGWIFTELGKTPNTFVHEIELGDIDGDGHLEIYFTPSDRNRSNGTSQAGQVARYVWNGHGYDRETVIDWDSSHAKEILTADLDGDHKDELYAVREAEVTGTGADQHILSPVRILRLAHTGKGTWSPSVIATLQDRQARFLTPADVDGDGKLELVCAGMQSGLWLLRPHGDTLSATLIDADSSGFEHAVDAADFDGDGKDELYVAADRQHEIRRYAWDGSKFARTTLATIPALHITWNIQDASL